MAKPTRKRIIEALLERHGKTYAAELRIDLDKGTRTAIGVLTFGLALSIALMAVAAKLVGSLLERHRWLAYLGVAVVAYVALDMIWCGTSEVMNGTAGW